MIPTLQKKFVMTAMAAITVLIVFMLGAINIANMVIVGGQIDRTLRVVAEHEGGSGLLPRPDTSMPRPFMDPPKNDYDTFLSSNFFVVRFDRSGAVLSVDVSRTSAVTEAEAEAEDAASTGSSAAAGSGTEVNATANAVSIATHLLIIVHPSR